MLYNEKTAREAVKKDCTVFYFYSAEEAQLRNAAAKVLSAMQGEDTELTTLEGPTPALEEVVMAAGTISFFGTRRLVEMPMLKPSAYSDKDLDELADTLASAENAVFVITSLVTEEWGKLRLSKREQKLIAACEKLGYCAQVDKLRPADLVKMMQERAQEMGAQLDAKVARALMDRCGEDQFLLENEVDKLAALADYKTITPEMVSALGTQSLDADTFEMINQLTSGKLPGAINRLDTLFKMQNEPIAILGAMISNYIDLYRLACGGKAQAGPKDVHKDFHYKGSSYRLEKASAAAQRLGKKRLKDCICLLEETDLQLKSNPMDSQILLQTALFRLAQAGGAR